jgi:hypothetical protein
MLVVKYVYLYLEHGEEVLCKIGIQKYQHYCKYLFQFNQLLWLNKYISINLVSNMNKVQFKAKRKTKDIQILLDMVMLNLL